MNHPNQLLVKSYSDIALNKEGHPSSPPAKAPLSARASATPPEEIALAPEESNLGLGCGNPFRIVSVQPGEVVVDLGSGAGFDCFLASHLTGRRGKVIGVDMTYEMLSLSRRLAKEKTAFAMWNFVWEKSKICPLPTTPPMWSSPTASSIFPPTNPASTVKSSGYSSREDASVSPILSS